jgi:RNA polymerase sigma-70 factor, ECF subfamily
VVWRVLDRGAVNDNSAKARHARRPANSIIYHIRRSPIRRWNKLSRCPLLSRNAIPEPPPDAESAAMSAGFSDQLIAVLPRLRRFARGLTGSVTEADDLVQAACERALSRMEQFQEGTRFDSWMFRIVQTIWIDQLRARKVRKEDGEVDGERLGSDEAVRRVESRIALVEVRRAVSRLPVEQRTALLLVTVEGMSYKEAAEIAKVPVGTIMSRLARARVALQAQLDAGGGLRRSTDDAETG